MPLSRAVTVVGVVIALAGGVAVQAPAGGVDLVPVLTSTPFGAAGGQQVSHTIVVSGTGTGAVTGVRVTFTTTVGLVGAAATASQGRCSIAGERTVVCDVGVLNFPAAGSAPPKVTITGTVEPGSPAGTLVQNAVAVGSATPDADTANNAASNAYLIHGPSGAPTAAASIAATPTTTARAPGYVLPVAAGVLLLAALAGAALLRRRPR